MPGACSEKDRSPSDFQEQCDNLLEVTEARESDRNKKVKEMLKCLAFKISSNIQSLCCKNNTSK